MILLLILLGRLFFVQILQGDSLSKDAQELWNREIPFAAKRGRILDRLGRTLVDNVSSPSVVAVPVQVDHPGVTARALADILNAPVQKIEQQLTKRQFLVKLNPWGRRISPEQEQRLRELRLPGISLMDDTKRIYPHKTLAAHVLGFTGNDNQGLAGLERTYEQNLRGESGSIQFAANARGETLPGSGGDRFYPPRDGEDLVTTLDLTIQRILERILNQAMVQYQPDAVWAMVMDPRNGDVLAMGNRPTFDPYRYREADGDVLFRNLPIWKTYEPGSTFKIATLAAALEEEKVELTESFFDPGAVYVGKSRLRCWKAGGHGKQTFREVVENSCNPGFVELGQRLGKEKLFHYLYKLGFGKKTGIDLPGEAGGILFPLSRVGPVELATTAFGQGVAVTPLQQVAAVAGIVNGGWKVTPHLALGWQNSKTGAYRIFPTRMDPPERVVSKNTSQQVCLALESVVARGTGRRAFVDGYRVGGKTGTAQKVGPGGHYLQNNHIVSFLGLAPADHPQLIVYVAVDNPKGIQFGGVVAAPLAGRILSETLHYLRIPYRTQQIPPEDSAPSKPYEEVPDLLGLTLEQMRSNLHAINLKIYMTGKGDRVIKQAPKAGTRVKEDSTIRIYLGSDSPPFPRDSQSSDDSSSPE